MGHLKLFVDFFDIALNIDRHLYKLFNVPPDPNWVTDRFWHEYSLPEGKYHAALAELLRAGVGLDPAFMEGMVAFAKTPSRLDLWFYIRTEHSMEVVAPSLDILSTYFGRSFKRILTLPDPGNFHVRNAVLCSLRDSDHAVWCGDSILPDRGDVGRSFWDSVGHLQ